MSAMIHAIDFAIFGDYFSAASPFHYAHFVDAAMPLPCLFTF
jgi:hypothetical protein